MKVDNLYQAMTLSTLDPLITIDALGIIQSASVSAERVFGWSIDELIGQNINILMPEPYHSEHDSYLENYRRTGKTAILGQTREFQAVRRDGSVFPCEIAVSLTEVAGWDAPLFTGIIRDISDRKRIEEALKKSEAEHRAMLSSMLDPLIAINSQGVIQFASDSVEQVFGWSVDELQGQYINVLMPEPYRTDHHTYLANYRRTGKMNILGRTLELVALRKDGSEFPCEITVTLTVIPGQCEPLFTGIIRDISERKHAEEERRKLNEQIQHVQKLESLGVLAGGIAHDFNNLLMGVLGNASIALEDLSPVSPARYSIQQIETAAKRAADLTQQMLAYSGRGQFVIERADISALVEEMGHLLTVSISKKVVLKYDLAENLPAIEIDATQVRQIVMNLITNASDAIGEKSGSVTVATGAMDVDREYLAGTFLDEELPEGLYVFIEVSDTGCGMNAETRAKLFDPFFTTKSTGRGLGMAAVLGIVRGHRAAIKCYSEVGRGTTFKILFPATDDPADRLADPGETDGLENWRGSGTVLLVDDEETVRAVAKRILERAGFRVLVAVDGREGVECFAAQPDEIDLVLLDMTMPRLNGDETFREMRRVREDVRVVLSSGYNHREAVDRFAGKGLAGFIQKPYQPKELLAVIRQALPQ